MSKRFNKLSMGQVAASNYQYLLYSFGHFLNSMDRLECRLIELYAAAPHLSVLDASDGQVREMAIALRSRGIRVCCLTQEQCVYPVSLACEDATIRSRSIGSFERCVDIAAMLEAPMVLVTAGRGYEDGSAQDAFVRAAEALRGLAEYAAARGVTLVLEWLTVHRSNVVNSCESLRRMLDEVKHPALKGMLDICGVARTGADMSGCLRQLGADMAHFHLTDFSPHGRFVPGDGELPIPKYIRALDDFGYTGALAFEVINPIYEFAPHECTRRCMAYMRELLSA